MHDVHYSCLAYRETPKETHRDKTRKRKGMAGKPKGILKNAMKKGGATPKAKPKALAKAALKKAKPLPKGQRLVKGTALRKAALTKAKGEALGKANPSSGSKPVQKGNLKAKPLKKGKLCKRNLSRLQKMSLSEKIAAINEDHSDEEEAAEALKKAMTPAEQQSLWQKHQGFLKKNPDEKKVHEKRGKLEKGHAAALWLLKKSDRGSRFLHCKEAVDTDQTWSKQEKWASKKEFLQLMEVEEFDAHLASGRIIWRVCPHTPGVYEYQDTASFMKESKVKKGRSTSKGVEYDPDEQEEEAFASLWGADGHSGVLAIELEAHPLGKGKAFGKGKDKGKGKGKGKGKVPVLAIKDKDQEEDDLQEEEEEEEEQPPEETLEKVMKRAKRARDACSSQLDDLEEVLEKAKSRLSKSAREDTEKKLQALKKAQLHLKNVLAKKPSLEVLKPALVKCASLCKDAKEEAKELKQLANKAFSKASTAK